MHMREAGAVSYDLTYSDDGGDKILPGEVILDSGADCSALPVACKNMGVSVMGQRSLGGADFLGKPRNGLGGFQKGRLPNGQKFSGGYQMAKHGLRGFQYGREP